jgi:hypothetical protein
MRELVDLLVSLPLFPAVAIPKIFLLPEAAPDALTFVCMVCIVPS